MIVKKRILPILMAIMLVITMMPMIAGTAYADSEIEVDGVKYSLNDNNMIATVSKYTGDSGEVVIPDTVDSNGDTYTVTSIGEGAFSMCRSLTSITIPESVTSIGQDAFSMCTNLGTVGFAEGSKLEGIGKGAFYSCKGLTSITIPKNVTSIGEGAFYKCTKLGTVEFAEGSKLESIGKSAFRGHNSLTSITIPASVTSIGESAFSMCTSLTSITIPENVTSIEQDTFLSCEGLTSITIPKNVTSIGEGAFYKCTKLGTVEFAEGSKLESIGKSAFRGPNSLTSITIPASVTSIGESAFSMCTSLTSITIPVSVTSIDEDAFGGCGSLTTIHFGGSPSQWEAITGGGKPNIEPADYGKEDVEISLKLSVYDAANNSWPDADDPAYITSATINGKDTRTTKAPDGVKATIVITPADGYMVQGVKVNDSQTPWNVVQDFQSWTDPKTGVHTITFSPPAGADYEFSVSLHEAVRVTYDLNGGTVGNNWLGNTRIVSKGSVVTGIGYEFEKITPPAGKFLSAVEITTASGVYTIAAAKLNSTAHKYDSDVTFKCIWGPFTQTITASDFTKTYGDAPFSLGAKTNGDGRLTYKSADTKVVTVDSTGKVTIKGAGTAKITISAAATADYQAASKTITVTVRKATNPLTMKVKTATVKYKKLKKKTQTLKVSKVIRFTKKGQGAMQYKLYSVKKGKKSFKKYFKIASKSGKVTVKKGLKRGTYKVKVKVKAGGNANYQPSAWKTETFKVRVK